MTLTTKKLIKMDACQSGKDWFLCYSKTGSADADTTIRELIKQNKLDWANWTIGRLLNNDDKLRYAIFAAREVLSLYENEYPNDLRPRKAIEASEKYLKGKTAAAAAYAAANAAYAAANAAYAANAANAAAAAAYRRLS